MRKSPVVTDAPIEWTPELTDLVLRLDREGRRPADIAKELGERLGRKVKPTSVTSLIHRNDREGHRRRRREANQHIDEQARELSRQGYSGRKIAAQLGIDRNRVPSPVRMHRARPPTRASWPPRHFPGWSIADIDCAEADLLAEPITQLGKALLDLAPGECRWPIGLGIDGGRRFCAEQQLTGSSYCDRHKKRSVRACTREEADLANDLPPVPLAA